MKRLLVLVMVLMMLVFPLACKKTGANKKGGTSDADSSNGTANTVVKLPDIVTGSMQVLDMGTIKFTIYPNEAPQSALNFIYLAQSGHFNGILVDKVKEDTYVQAGKYESKYRPRALKEYGIAGEFAENNVVNNLAMTEGAMVWVLEDKENGDSAHAQFRIYPYYDTLRELQGKYAVFGYITGDESFDVVKKMNKRKLYKGRPKKEIMITSVVIDEITQAGFPVDFKFPEPNFLPATKAK